MRLKKLVGLTGKTGAGKSTVSAYFKEKGASSASVPVSGSTACGLLPLVSYFSGCGLPCSDAAVGVPVVYSGGSAV